MVVALIALLIACEDPEEKCPIDEGKFQVHVISLLKQPRNPPLARHVNLESDARLTGFHGETIDDKALRQSLRDENPIKENGTCLIVCPMATAGDPPITVATLGRVLDRLRDLADPKRKTTIYVTYYAQPYRSQKKP